ncbi:MAG: leucyl aminopeptidase [Pseudomonadales bacterium]|nr:leucyl aminopeptidase [Halieaceae bacterium]MCP5190786.1 leucyl aminopeptidase [Pseudomonadales bacterium]MCP5205091.1 leucyl aminopeptidase [Pseudomonadales bacterium]
MSKLTFTARKIKDAAQARSQCAILPVFGKKALSTAAQQVDKACDGAVSAAIDLGDFSGKSGQTCMLPGVGGNKRLLLVGCGDKSKFDRAAARELAKAISKALASCEASEATVYCSDLEVKDGDPQWLLAWLARHFTCTAYRYTETVSKPKPAQKLARVVLEAGSLSTGAAQKALDQGLAVGLGINEARNLANLPGNICTPSYLAQHARKLARGEPRLNVSILEEKKMKELGMGSLLSVSAGSDQPAKLVIMHYKGGKSAQKPYVLVGKGITFDSGGISIKPGAKMDEMKFDMGGAASVFGTLRTVTELGLPINVVGIVAAAENMPSGGATKPGDVVTSMAGKTIEVLNTDAEGRLVLCDALTYAGRFKPQVVIDIATLTGACVVALGAHASGLYANDDKLAEALLAAGTESHDRAWRMPLWDDYQKQLDSNFADIANIGGPGGGSITAACFLSRFTGDYHWAHLDIAGSAWDSAPKGATGRPVGLLSQYLIEQAG